LVVFQILKLSALASVLRVARFLLLAESQPQPKGGPMIRSILSILVITTIAFAGAMMAQGKKQAPPGKIEPYSMTAIALKGASLTDVYATITTADAGSYPVPGSLKKLQIKILNDSGDVVYIENFKEVPVVDGRVSVSVDGLHPLMPVAVQAHIKTDATVDEEVLRAKTVVLLRPDLAIDTVRAPAAVRVNTLFDIEVVVKEVNGQTGATGSVSLWEGDVQLAAVGEIEVLAGDMVSVLFQGMQLSGMGSHQLTAKVHGAVPAEYEIGNNEAAFTVEAVNPMVGVSYNLMYNSKKNHSYYYSYSTTCGDYESTTVHNNFDEMRYSAYFSPPGPLVAPLDSLALQVISQNGTVLNVSVASLTPSWVGPDYDEYNFSVQSAGSPSFYVTLRSYHYGYATLQVYKFARDYYYVYSASNGGYYRIEQHDQMLNFQGFVEVRMALWDGYYAGGGGASMTMQPFQNYFWSNNSSGGWICWYYTNTYESYQYSSSYKSGTTDPTVLPGMSLARKDVVAELLVPTTTDLVQNYPNPFNPETNIQFTVEQSGPAVLKVFDMLGKEVAELFSGEAEKGRIYRFTFHASEFASGMYYSRLEVGGKQYVKRMILMK
jgi:hypothetical protein